MPLFKGHVGINLASNKMQIVEIDFRDNKFYLENVDEEYFSEIASPKLPESKFISILQDAFNKLTSRKTLSTNLISFSLPIDFFKIVRIAYDNSMVRSDLFEHFKWELSVLFPQFAQEDFITQFIEHNENNSIDEKKVIIIGAVKAYIKSIHKFCVRNNLKLKFVDFAHIAANSIIKLNHKDNHSDTILSFYIADNWVSTVLLKGNTPLYIDNSIISSFEDAKEKLKISYSKVVELIPSQEIKFNYLFGNSLSSQIVSDLENSIGISLKKVNPFNQFNKSETTNSLILEDTSFTFSAATGIALRLI